MSEPTRVGCRPDSPEKSAKFRFVDQTTPPQHSASASFEALEDPAVDQNNTEGCVGHGPSQWLRVTYAKAGKPLPFRPSPKGIYAITRELDRRQTMPIGQPLPPLVDQGAEIADMVIAVATLGIRPLVLPSPLGFQSDVDQSNVLEEEKLGELELSMGEILAAAVKIDPTQQYFADAAAANLEATGALNVGIFVDSSFFAYSPATGPLKAVNLQDPRGGGHCTCLTSFRTATDADFQQWGIAAGTLIFRGINSWGTQWGDNGHFEIAATYFTPACQDCYALHL